MKVKYKFVFVIVLVVAITLFCMSFIVGYGVYNHIFPKAEPIICPEADSITAFLLTKDNDTSVNVEVVDYDDFLQNIEGAQPTRTMSVNDYPVAQSYYTIKIDSTVRDYPYYIYLYVENSKVYLEIPYEGIYTSNQQFLDSVAEYYNEVQE